MSESQEVTSRPENSAELADLIESLTVFDYGDDGEGYEKAADAMWEAALAAFNYVARRVGATGFQASWSALKFYGEAMSVRGPFMVIKAEDALYPQYNLPGRLSDWLDECAPWLAEQAEEKLADHESRRDSMAVDSVVNHWRMLAGRRTS